MQYLSELERSGEGSRFVRLMAPAGLAFVREARMSTAFNFFLLPFNRRRPHLGIRLDLDVSSVLSPSNDEKGTPALFPIAKYDEDRAATSGFVSSRLLDSRASLSVNKYNSPGLVSPFTIQFAGPGLQRFSEFQFRVDYFQRNN